MKMEFLIWFIFFCLLIGHDTSFSDGWQFVLFCSLDWMAIVLYVNGWYIYMDKCIGIVPINGDELCYA